jgi:hypothetical protein
MVLYHSTTLHNFGMDTPGTHEWTADLQPTPSDLIAHVLGPDFAEERVVWLTAEPNSKNTWQGAPKYLLRIAIDLDRNTKRLVRWLDYVRKHRPGMDTIITEEKRLGRRRLIRKSLNSDFRTPRRDTALGDVR